MNKDRIRKNRNKFQNEQIVVESLVKAVEGYARLNNLKFMNTPLSGQDRWTAADQLFVSSTRFALVELKWSRKSILKEFKKERLIYNICVEIPKDPNLFSIHNECHFIAWSDKKDHHKPIKRDLKMAKYGDCVCRSWFEYLVKKASKIISDSRHIKERMLSFESNVEVNFVVYEFCEYLFSKGKEKLNSFSSVDLYIRSLMKYSSDYEDVDLIICSYNTETGNGSFFQFNDLREAYEWFVNNKGNDGRNLG